MIEKITYQDKESLKSSQLNPKNVFRDVDANHLKEVINNNADELDSTNVKITNLEENQVTGVVQYSTLAELPVTGTLNVSYKVTNDGTNNGYYHWNGSAYIKDEDPNLTQSIEPDNTTEAPSNKAVYDTVHNNLNRKSKVSEGKNLLDSSRLLDGYYIKSDGTFAANSIYAVTDFIPISEGVSLISSTNFAGGTYNNFYDSNFNLISTIAQIVNVAVVGIAGASYTRQTYRTTPEMQIEIGTVKTDYVPYTSNYENEEALRISEENTQTVFDNQVTELYNENYSFDILYGVPNTIINAQGNLQSVGGYNTTDLIEVKNASVFKMVGGSTPGVLYANTYDKNGVVLRTLESQSDGFEVTFTEDEIYFRKTYIGTPTASILVLATTRKIFVEKLPNNSNIVYLAVDGLDTNDGTYDSPLLTLEQAYKQLTTSGKVVLKNGEYWGLELEFKDGVSIEGETKENTRVINGQKLTSATLESGYTKVYKNNSPYVYDANEYQMFQYDTPDPSTLISDSERLAVHKGLDYRCPITRTLRSASSLAEIEASSELLYYWDGSDLYFSISSGTNLTDNPIFVPPFTPLIFNIDVNISNITMLGFGISVKSAITRLTNINIGCNGNVILNANSNSETDFGTLFLDNVNSFQTEGDASGANNYGKLYEFNSWFHDCDDEGSSAHELSCVERVNSIYEANVSNGIVDVGSCSIYMNGCYFQLNSGSTEFTPYAVLGKNFLNARIINCVLQESIVPPDSGNVKYLGCSTIG